MSVSDRNPRVGVYICHCGGNISDYVDVREVREQAAKMEDVTVARNHVFVCSDPGQELILEDIKSGLVNRVVIASCSPRLHEITFRNALRRAGLNPYLYIHVNIREQVSWVSHGMAATLKAITLVAAGVAKARLIKSLEPTRVESNKHVTVIGAGVAGLKAAWDLGRRGIKVTLLEKSPFLGGSVARLDRLFPTGENAGEFLSELTGKVLHRDNIEVITCAEVVRQEGYIGNFTLKYLRRPPKDDETLAKLALARQSGKIGAEFVPFVGVCPFPPPSEEENTVLNTGAVVIATGFQVYQPYQGEFRYGQNPQVITLAELIQKQSQDAGDSNGRLMFNGRPVRSMAIIHCVGSRQVPGVNQVAEGQELHQHCSRTCCTSLINNALNIRQCYPETEVYDIYRDIRTYGRGHEEIYLNASAAGVRFLRFRGLEPPVVEEATNDDYALTVKVREITFPDDELEIPVDLVVLGTGMLPGRIEKLVDVMKCPTGPDGFLQEVHPKIRPVELATAGIYLAGSCQAPMNIAEAASAASAAAAKVSAVLSKSVVELEPFVAKVNSEKCSACLTCVRSCPFGVPKIVDGKAHIEPAACYGCGACSAECPGKAVSLAHFDDDHILASKKAIVTGKAS
ncbi:MAG: CoB--CoM heterodisulfide reductase iron-sulfur subunit A family protein [Deltaproteobacteria bacterium]|nr:CoB--CoM heterodisulfide reductase iron-sulfur subunit A family protein [Deltaproteobacteria bacterium]MBW2053000.1 CoB--CoM heterodisulfide reductase iron-sulfur subunit A family protein [Deltaproteobacteria bacterium]MBW2141635.1 CoB--CoM heterodisulfide reductase iron-sulfur subunit A family protein [Deltaproteobacteria bacterium]MBW2323129.1 CoB--CoM heterodisulfide reductase iron-sulfur subunit A family protein [Deltaproteobacteria bacterium]